MSRRTQNWLKTSGDYRGKTDLDFAVEVPKGVAGLTKDSVVDCGFISTVPKDKLGNTIGTLPLDHMKEVDRALRVSLSLE